MNEKELRGLIEEVIKEELAQMKLKEEVEGPGYVIKAWDTPDKKRIPTFDSVKQGKKYKDFDEVLAALQSSELSDLGAYEVTWVKTGESLKEASRLAYEIEPDEFELEDKRIEDALYGEGQSDYADLGPLFPEAEAEIRDYGRTKFYQ